MGQLILAELVPEQGFGHVFTTKVDLGPVYVIVDDAFYER